jgi:transposase
MAVPARTSAPWEVDEEIILHHQMGWTIRKIAAPRHTGHHRILDVIAAHRQDRELLHIKGRPPKVTPEIAERVVSITMDDGSLSNPKLAQILQSEAGVTLSAESIRTTR